MYAARKCPKTSQPKCTTQELTASPNFLFLRSGDGASCIPKKKHEQPCEWKARGVFYSLRCMFLHLEHYCPLPSDMSFLGFLMTVSRCPSPWSRRRRNRRRLTTSCSSRTERSKHEVVVVVGVRFRRLWGLLRAHDSSFVLGVMGPSVDMAFPLPGGPACSLLFRPPWGASPADPTRVLGTPER